MALPVWHPWQLGSSSQPVRLAAHHAHVAVTALTLHGHRAVGRIDRLAHRAPQASGDRAGMTGVTGQPIVLRVERQAIARVHHGGVVAVDGGGELRNAEQLRERQRFRQVARGANERFLVHGHRGVKTGGVEGLGGQRGGVERGVAGPLSFVVQAQNVEPVIAPGVRVIDPAGRGARRRAGAGQVAQAAVHLVGHRQDDVVGGEHLAQAVGGDQAHHRILVRLAGVVRREYGDAVGDKPVHVRTRRVIGCGTLARAGHVVDDAGRIGDRQPRVHRQRRADDRAHVVVEIALARRGGVNRAGRVGDGLGR